MTNIIRVKYVIYKYCDKMLSIEFPHIKWPAKWTDLIQKFEGFVQDIKVGLVAWSKPPDQWIKVNTDGNALTNQGRLGAGGILMDKDGHLCHDPNPARDWHPHLPSYVSEPTHLTLNISTYINRK